MGLDPRHLYIKLFLFNQYLYIVTAYDLVDFMKIIVIHLKIEFFL